MISKEIDLMQRRMALFPDSIEVLAKLGAGFYRRSQFRTVTGILPQALKMGNTPSKSTKTSSPRLLNTNTGTIWPSRIRIWPRIN